MISEPEHAANRQPLYPWPWKGRSQESEEKAAKELDVAAATLQTTTEIGDDTGIGRENVIDMETAGTETAEESATMAEETVTIV